VAPSSRKAFPYPIYFIRINPDVHVQMFQKVIQVNDEKWDTNIMNLFSFTLRDEILGWGENFMQSHLGCIFLELKIALCKLYHTMQNDEQVYMAF